MTIAFDNSYARDLAGMYLAWHVSPAPQPSLVWLNEVLCADLGFTPSEMLTDDGLAMLAASTAPDGAQPIAQAYAGHQFGHFSPQLGDGRALLLGEVLDLKGRRRDIAFKGSGRTPFSRGGDGKATLSSVLREVIISEAMHALGVSTTRSLAAVATGESIMRERAMPAGVLTRIASSHIRVGSFEFFAARGDEASLRRLADYAINRHATNLVNTPDRYLQFLKQVIDRQAQLIAQWMGFGFIHGVMNTDNMTVSGETIDYGPCAFMEIYNPATVFSSIDTHGRYAYANQPSVAKWNLSRLASALLPLIDTDIEHAKALAIDAVNTFDELYDAYSLAIWRGKLGLSATADQDNDMDMSDKKLAVDFLQLLQDHKVDFTQGWRSLVAALQNNDQPLRALLGNTSTLTSTFTSNVTSISANLDAWLQRWQLRTAMESADPTEATLRLTRMKRANPVYIPRNHLVEQALSEATERQNLQPFTDLMKVLSQPHELAAVDNKYEAPAPAAITASYKTFCGT